MWKWLHSKLLCSECATILSNLMEYSSIWMWQSKPVWWLLLVNISYSFVLLSNRIPHCHLKFTENIHHLIFSLRKKTIKRAAFNFFEPKGRTIFQRKFSSHMLIAFGDWLWCVVTSLKIHGNRIRKNHHRSMKWKCCSSTITNHDSISCC